MKARSVFRVLGYAVAILGLLGVGLCGALLLLAPEGAGTAAMLSRALTGSAALAGTGAFVFLKASGSAEDDQDSFGT